ncbi:MAG: hypothetical protein FWD34_08810 [Oscillospiraceae bacterium]|nr:hypothetical protein [Oscillospiraceae bacterium]
MKKKLLTITLAVVMFIGIVACNQSIPENWQNDDNSEQDNPYATYETRDFVVPDTTPAATTPPEPLEFMNEQAEELYDIIMANKHVWERREMVSGTLIDLDFCGTPEFILTHNGYQDSMSVFKIDGETMREIKTFEHLYYSEEAFIETRSIIPYTDQSWLIPYLYDGDYRLSAFDFTSDEIKETVMFNSIIHPNYGFELENYYGYPFLYAEFYINGELYEASPEKTKQFYDELYEHLVEGEKQAAESEIYDDMGWYLPWGCAGYYPNATQTEWEELKSDFMNTLLAVEPAYNLFPNFGELFVWIFNDEFSWNNPKNISPSLNELVNAYYSGDDDYFKTYDLFYDNGGAACKPVIYLYPEDVTDIKVLISFPNGGHFTATYPDYGNGWNVTAYPDGTLINHADGHEYSYLYWAGKGYPMWEFNEGFVVKGKDTAKFLQEKLSYLGMIPKEYNEFIVYWLPLMQNNEYNLITFQTDLYEESALMLVSPTPDSMLRVFMAYKPLDNYIDIPEQELEPFERHGFAVIEWGGTTVN